MPGMKKLFTVLANFGVKRDRYPIHEADAQELHAKSTQAYDAIRDKKKFISVKILNIIKIVRAVLEASEFELELSTYRSSGSSTAKSGLPTWFNIPPLFSTIRGAQ